MAYALENALYQWRDGDRRLAQRRQPARADLDRAADVRGRASCASGSARASCGVGAGRPLPPGHGLGHRAGRPQRRRHRRRRRVEVDARLRPLRPRGARPSRHWPARSRERTATPPVAGLARAGPRSRRRARPGAPCPAGAPRARARRGPQRVHALLQLRGSRSVSSLQLLALLAGRARLLRASAWPARCRAAGSRPASPSSASRPTRSQRMLVRRAGAGVRCGRRRAIPAHPSRPAPRLSS